MKGILTLIPTPIDEEGVLEAEALNLLKMAATDDADNSIFAIEDLKPGRRRWLRWGLPRENVESFVMLNEHTAKKGSQALLQELLGGKNVYLMSDGGLPAFCDPGRELVDLCHRHKIKVTCTPFPNSIALSIALSGFEHRKFIFEGFLSPKKELRCQELEELVTVPQTIVLMDTPYRLKRLLEDIEKTLKKVRIFREVFLALDLNSKNEKLLRGNISFINQNIGDEKREFVLLLSGEKNDRI